MSTIHGSVSSSVISSRTLTAWQAQGAVFDIVPLDVTAGLRFSEGWFRERMDGAVIGDG
ncbi:hypothetical protein [Streptomyces sp. NPDC059262]|uniref:hypothetical protein n=1 Tax=Streptomyces sp. NPDC059262 TaxID=3346797 RepID=UPI0036B15B92